MKEALGEYRTIECRQYPSISSCISNFCRDVSSCLSQTWKWRNLCFWRFFWFRLGKFDITAWKEVQSNTSIRNLQLGYCSRTYSSSHGRWRVNYKFSIITTEYSDHSENEGSKGMNSQRLCSRGWHIMLLTSSIIVFSIDLKRMGSDNRVKKNRTKLVFSDVSDVIVVLSWQK